MMPEKMLKEPGSSSKKKSLILKPAERWSGDGGMSTAVISLLEWIMLAWTDSLK